MFVFIVNLNVVDDDDDKFTFFSLKGISIIY